ncbi:MAG: N-acetylneuraminate synthase family protein [Promethearchaeia archaeon]
MAIKISNYKIDNYYQPFFIAEIGANHNGNLDLAKKLIDEAKKCGCHSVKLQLWSKESLFSSFYYKNKPIENELNKYSLKEEDFIKLKKYCDKKNIIFGASVFSLKEIDFLIDELESPYIKIPSPEITNFELLKKAAKKEIPIILSTGLSTIAEIDEAVRIITKFHSDLILLHCISLYPPNDDENHLNRIDLLRDIFNLPIGFSDHNTDPIFSIAAIVKGACIIERHFTLNKNMEGWDHHISSDTSEFTNLIYQCNRVYKALGTKYIKLNQRLLEMRKNFIKSIVAARDINKGEIFSYKNLTLKRPGLGLESKYFNCIIGKKAKRDIKKDDFIKLEDF